MLQVENSLSFVEEQVMTFLGAMPGVEPDSLNNQWDLLYVLNNTEWEFLLFWSVMDNRACVCVCLCVCKSVCVPVPPPDHLTIIDSGSSFPSRPAPPAPYAHWINFTNQSAQCHFISTVCNSHKMKITIKKSTATGEKNYNNRLNLVQAWGFFGRGLYPEVRYSYWLALWHTHTQI